MKLLKYALIVLFSAGMMSCGGGGGDDEPDVDNTAPTVTISAPTASTAVNAGENLSVNISVSDNIALSSYVLTVAYSGPKSVKTVEEFTFNSNSDNDANGNALPTISGTSSSINFQMETADNAKPGNYKLEIEVKDSSNNAKKADVTFEIK
jgi:uncharacterized membrane protein